MLRAAPDSQKTINTGELSSSSPSSLLLKEMGMNFKKKGPEAKETRQKRWKERGEVNCGGLLVLRNCTKHKQTDGTFRSRRSSWNKCSPEHCLGALGRGRSASVWHILGL